MLTATIQADYSDVISPSHLCYHTLYLQAVFTSKC